MNTNAPTTKSTSTPSLVGVSIRSINDSNNPDFQDDLSGPIVHSVSSSHVLNKIQSQPNTVNTSYTSVADLNREGALLTDEVDLDQVINATEELTDDLDKQRKLLLLKKKKELEKHKQKNKISASSSSASVSSSHSPDSKYLVTSTDPVDDQINITSTLKKGHQSRRRSGIHTESEEESENTIRNSYGQFIRNESHRPHLAGGDSYQSIHESESGLDSLDEERRNERSGRRSGRSGDKQSSTEYLRSLSRSLSRDPAKKRITSNVVNDASQSLNNSRFYSTNNYSISQADLENAPHIIQQTLAEEEEDEEEQGALMDDQGNDEYSRDLEEAAAKNEARHL